MLCLLSLTVLSTNKCAAQSLKDYDLTGNVKSIQVYHYTSLDGCDYCENLKDDSLYVEFNLKGNAVNAFEWYDSYTTSNINMKVTSYSYNDKGKIIEKIVIEDYSAYLKNTSKYFRDNQGYIIRVENYSKYGKQSYEYMAAQYGGVYGKYSKDVLESYREKLTDVEYRKNNDNGTAKEISYYNCDGSSKSLYKRNFYDESGNIIKSVNEPEGKYETYFREKYPDGTIYKCTTIYHNGNEETKCVFIYNKKGLLTNKSNYNANNKKISEIVWSYNEKGFVTNETLYNYDKNGNKEVLSKKTYTYKYDNYGNWIISKCVMDSYPADIIKRKITYY